MSFAYYEAGGNVSVSEADYIDLADVDAVRGQLGDMAEAVTGVMSSWDSITIDGNPRQMRILGSDELYRQARNLEVLDGRFLDQSDLESSPENSPDMLAVEAEFMLSCLLSVN